MVLEGEGNLLFNNSGCLDKILDARKMVSQIQIVERKSRTYDQINNVCM